MVAAFDYCLHGKGGAAPSIDTAMHGLVDAAHVDHLHPDSGIAIATSADGEALTKEIYGDTGSSGCRGAGPASSSGSTSPRSRPTTRRRSAASSAATASPPGATRRGVRGRTRCGSSRPPPPTSPSTARPSRSGPALDGYAALPEAERRARAAALAPTIRGIASADRPMVGHFTDSDVVLDFLARAEHPRLAELGTSCPDHFLRTKVKPLVLDLPADRVGRGLGRAAARARGVVPRGLPGLLRPQRGRRPTRPRDPRRGPADRAGARRRACSASARTSRPPGWPASSTSTRST